MSEQSFPLSLSERLEAARDLITADVESGAPVIAAIEQKLAYRTPGLNKPMGHIVLERDDAERLVQAWRALFWRTKVTVPKYPNAKIGDPLDLLIEECAEIIKEVSKAHRFTLDGDEYVTEHGNPPPRLRILTEIGDLLFILDVLVDRGLFTRQEYENARRAKFARMYELFGSDKVLAWIDGRSS